MDVSNIYTHLQYGVSYKTFQNHSIGQKLVQTSAQLVQDLERAYIAQNDTTLPIAADIDAAEDTLDTLIAKSIKEIVDIRKSLGITKAAGQNKPLEDLFKTVKGSVFNQTV